MNSTGYMVGVGSLRTGTIGTIFVHADTQISAAPIHRGHHPVWSGPKFHVDICNMVDDVVVRDHSDDSIYRFPIDRDLLPWLETLIRAMNEYDQMSGSPWQIHNAHVRASIMRAVMERLDGNAIPLNVFEPGRVAPALIYVSDPAAVDRLLCQIISERPEALVH